ncbi:uncharacterized protein BDCG_08767 [Blastomyces dermatitidis ER-3]|uniref:Uncharacterized protein n=1 Tax=Ajellomyces dermatitidis (strain ER-3 / ATCC MYA-2586) TaxID=559297 RepID=A0ABP2EPM8_AJEDR|nr:uncharacterized protein BDCG_08767 [Blastomyces dermatitidis ER-3]EEQ85498.2 hypothetical protein BDCG_08767 [Blastomyces dermatitidis ER-3]EQL35002.1 hypothetical protein BDFG_03223 [Blastomyces dermatitidis ATCC 26199]
MTATQTQKIAVMKHLAKKVVETEGRFSWTAIAVGNFFLIGLLNDSRPSVSTYPTRRPESTTEATNPSQAVVGTFFNPTETANKFLRIRSLQTTQNQILAAFEQISDSKWAVERISTNELYRAGKEKLEKGEEGWILDILCTQIFANGGDRSIVATREDSVNALVRVREVELADVIRDIRRRESRYVE